METQMVVGLMTTHLPSKLSIARQVGRCGPCIHIVALNRPLWGGGFQCIAQVSVTRSPLLATE